MDVPGFALVTGAASGLGLTCAKRFAAEGAAGVALFDLNLEAAEAAKVEVEKAAANHDFKALALQVNVSEESNVERAVDQVKDKFGRIDYVVNSAGIVVIHEHGSAYAETSDWKKVLAVNLDGTFFVSRAVAKVMLAQTPVRSGIDDGRRTATGSIVNVASIAGVVGVIQSTAYASSKHAVVGLTKTMSEDHAKDGLRVNVVCPGYIETPMTQSSEAVAQEVAKRTAAMTPMRRLGKADEVADAVVFLAGGRSSYTTGAVLMVDGGYSQR